MFDKKNKHSGKNARSFAGPINEVEKGLFFFAALIKLQKSSTSNLVVQIQCLLQNLIYVDQNYIDLAEQLRNFDDVIKTCKQEDMDILAYQNH